MADYLRAWIPDQTKHSQYMSSSSSIAMMASSGTPSSVHYATQPRIPSRPTAPGIHEVSTPPINISLLSLPLQSIAHTLSQPGLDQSLFFTSPPFDTSSPPGLRKSIGNLRCGVISSILLRHAPASSKTESDGQPEVLQTADDDSHGSEMFICQVLSVDMDVGEERDQPLLYWKQRYIGVEPDG